MSKPTPGPWVAAGTRVDGPDGELVTYLTGYAKPTPRQAANARLIAAAPDLLEALQQVRKWAEGDDENYTGDHPIARARAAIAKATGSAS